jgi:hypothetical protein
LAVLVPHNEEHRVAIETIRRQIWELYQDLKAYCVQHDVAQRPVLEACFDTLVDQRPGYPTINGVLKEMRDYKADLLRVLEQPQIPLHTNAAESDIREFVKRRKISGGTWSDAGRRCRDTFASLKKTCRKLGLRFWDYLQDRVYGAGPNPPPGRPDPRQGTRGGRQKSRRRARLTNLRRARLPSGTDLPSPQPAALRPSHPIQGFCEVTRSPSPPVGILEGLVGPLQLLLSASCSGGYYTSPAGPVAAKRHFWAGPRTIGDDGRCAGPLSREWLRGVFSRFLYPLALQRRLLRNDIAPQRIE